MIACCLTVLLGVLGQWSPLNVERIDPAPVLRVMSNTSQTISACGPGWVAAGYATTSPPATLVYGDFGGPPQTQVIPSCYGIHGRGDRLAITRSSPKVLDLYAWTGAAFALEQSIDLGPYLTASQWPYHVYVAVGGDVLIATGYPAPTRLLAVQCPSGGTPLVYPPVEVGATGSLKAFTGDSLIVGEGTNQPNVRAWTWSGMAWTGTLLPTTPGNDLHTFRAGGVPVMYKTGHSLVKAKLKETGAPFAGEMSGHIFFAERWYGFDDATYTAGRLLEILSKVADPSAVLDALPTSFSTPELNVACAEGEHHEVIEKLRQTARFEGAELTTIDGLRADYPDGFGLVRASNTTPVLVLRFEGQTPEALARIQAHFMAAVLAVKPDAHLGASAH